MQSVVKTGGTDMKPASITGMCWALKELRALTDVMWFLVVASAIGAIANCQNSPGCDGVFSRIFVRVTFGDELAMLENAILAFLPEVSSWEI